MPHEPSIEADVVWNQCLELIKDKITPQAFKTWFEPTRPVRLEDTKLTIQVPNQFFYEWIEEHYYSVVRKTIVQVLGQDAQLVYHTVRDEVAEAPEARTVTRPAYGQADQVESRQNGRPSAPAHAPHFNVVESPYAGVELNPRFTFENFITGECNQLAYAAAKAVADNPGRTRFNPMVIYGGTGLGKTHLAQAIGHTILERGLGDKVIYTTSERFTLDFVDSLQNKKTHEFNNYYRTASVLIIDDIQFFANKEATQDNFFHTFNALNQAGKQIILTSDVPPKQLTKVNERLISRFQWGLTTDMQPPDLETRIAILQQMSEAEGYQLPGEVIEYVAHHVRDSVRELEGCLISLLAKASLDNKPLTLELTREVISGIASVQEENVTAEQIQQAVCEHLSVPMALLTGKSRKQEIVFARQIAMFLIRELTNASLKTIGNYFGGRDHTTVMHAINMVERMIETEEDHARRTMNGLYRSLRVAGKA